MSIASTSPRRPRRAPRGRGPRALVFAACLLVDASALANGRFPRAQRLLEDPADPTHLVLAATYGLLMTNDRGGAWYHTCEAVLTGSDAYAGDLVVGLAGGGVVLVGYPAGMRRSTDGCRWTSALDTAADASARRAFVDYAIDAATRRRVVAIATTDSDAGHETTLLASDDAGATWTAFGAPVPLADPSTVDLDPADPDHILASGLSESGEGLIVDSRDRGASWTAMTIPGTGDHDVPYIAAVDPHDGRRVFVRTDSTVVAGGELAPNDALLLTRDGGATWTTLVRRGAKLFGFALSPDASQIAVGYGGPEPPAAVAPTELGILVASTADYRFSSVFGGEPVTCLTWTAAGTYACTQRGTPEGLEELVFFPDGAFTPEAAAPTSLLTLGAVRGPPPCCPAVGGTCNWATECVAFGACGDAAVAPPLCDAASPAGDAATVDGGDARGLDHAGGGGCGCVTAGRPSRRDEAAWAAMSAALACAGVLLVRRRRARTAAAIAGPGPRAAGERPTGR